MDGGELVKRMVRIPSDSKPVYGISQQRGLMDHPSDNKDARLLEASREAKERYRRKHYPK